MTPLLLYFVKVAAVLALALLALLLLRRRSAEQRHWVLLVCIVLAAALPAVQQLAPAWRIALTGTSSSEPLRWADVAAPAVEPAAAPIAPPVSRLDGLRPVAARAVLPLWLAGVGLGVVWLLVGIGRLAWLERRAISITDGPWARAMGELAREHGIPPVLLLRTPHPALLVTWGWIRPSVLLPADADGWEDSRIRIVLRHELAHVIRGDWLAQMLAELLRCVHWFDPLAWMACKRLRLESEHACDDRVLRAGIQAPAYAAELLQVARAFRSHAWPCAPAVARPSTLHRRIRAMLKANLDRRPATRPFRVLSLVLLSGVAMAAAGFGAGAAPMPVQVVTQSAAAEPAAGTPAAAVLSSAAPVRVSPAPAPPPAPAPAQGGAGTVSGVISDPTGGALPGAAVALRREVGGGRVVISTRTDGSGAFELSDVPAGEYALDVTLPGFRTASTRVTVATQGQVYEELTLHVGTLSETITVTSDFSGPSIVELKEEQARAAEVIRDAAARQPPAPAVPLVTGVAPDGRAVTKVGGSLRAPRKVRDVKPVYPAAAAAAGISGVVILQATIGIDGTVTAVAPLRSPNSDLTQAATEAVWGWQFTPTLLNNQPIATDMVVTVNFTGKPF
jgi:TonB family protein